MKWWRQLHSDVQSELQRTGIPRHVLRQAIGDSGPAPGSAILDAGCGCGELSGYLSRLGFDVTGFDESPEQIMAARRGAPGIEFVYGAAAALPFSAHQFDLVIVRGLSPYCGSIFDPSALRTSAQFLSCLRPGGRLLFLERCEAEPSSGHHAFCFTRHLECFPGEVRVWDPEAGRASAGWTAWLSGSQPGGFVVASLDCPALPRSRDEWLRIAASCRVGRHSFCCAWSEAASSGHRRFAA